MGTEFRSGLFGGHISGSINSSKSERKLATAQRERCEYLLPFFQSSLKKNWPPNTLDLNPVWEALQRKVYRRKISHIDWLEVVLIDCWIVLCQLQDRLNRWINQLSEILMMIIKTKGANFNFCSGLILCADDRCCYFYCMFELKIR